jgi:AraC-like DNA-binding protein
MGKKRRQILASITMVHILLKYASGIGINLAEICEVMGLGPDILESPEAKISIEQYNDIWKQVALRAEDQNFGLHLGEASQGFLGGDILFTVMMNCPTVGLAIEKLALYHDLTTNVVQLCLNQQGDRAYLSWNPIYPDIALDRHHSEAVLSGLAFRLCGLTEGEMQFVQVRFSHARPQDTTEHQRIFRCPVVFGQPDNALVLERAYLSRPIFLANPAFLERLEQFAQERLDRLYASDTWANKVLRLIGEVLWRGEKPTLETVAYELAISRRHLQNKLKKEGTTYRALLDQLRKEIALKYLKKPDVMIYDVAFLLGFSEQSAFNRAFKRWMGASPKEYRDREYT